MFRLSDPIFSIGKVTYLYLFFCVLFCFLFIVEESVYEEGWLDVEFEFGDLFPCKGVGLGDRGNTVLSFLKRLCSGVVL